MNAHMSTPGNTTKPGTAHSNIQTAQSSPSLVGSEPTMHYLDSTQLSQRISTLCQPGINVAYKAWYAKKG